MADTPRPSVHKAGMLAAMAAIAALPSPEPRTAFVLHRPSDYKDYPPLSSWRPSARPRSFLKPRQRAKANAKRRTAKRSRQRNRRTR